MSDAEKAENKTICGFETMEEFAAYNKGKDNMEQIIWAYIENWEGQTNIRMGDLLARKFNELKAVSKLA